MSTADVAGVFLPEAMDEITDRLIAYQALDERAEMLAWWMGRVLPAHKSQADYLVRIATARGMEALEVEPTCYVGTVHSFKGAEADVVFLAPDLSPAGWRAWNNKLSGGHDDVLRTIYVGMTRARQQLVLLDPASHNALHWRI